MAASITNINNVLNKFPKGDSSVLIPALQAIQSAFGWISEHNVYVLSEYLGIAPAKIYGVATFYANFRLQPQGRHIINICRGTACHVKGSERLMPIFEQELKCKVTQTTLDGKFTFNEVNCLGCCSLAPAVNIDNDFYGNVKANDIKRILRKYE